MRHAWSVFLLLGVATAAPPPPPASGSASGSYEQAVLSAVELYNQQQSPQFAFRLLEAEPQQPDWDPSGATPQVLKFSIKETVCPTSQSYNLTQCDYRDDGVDQDCSGFYSDQGNSPSLLVQCEDIDQELNRITRSRWRRFRRRAGRFFKKHGVQIALGLLRFRG